MAAKQNVKRRIVDAAWELFYEKGYDDTTVCLLYTSDAADE